MSKRHKQPPEVTPEAPPESSPESPPESPAETVSESAAEAASEASKEVSTDAPVEAADTATAESAADDAQSTGEPVASSVEHADEAPENIEKAQSIDELAMQVEVALMTTDRAMPAAKLAEILGQSGVKAINEAVSILNDAYEHSGRSFRVEQVAGGLQILTLPAYAGVMQRLHKTRSAGKLSPAAMETLAIIAYKQPVLRVQIEAIRGVASGEVVRSLMERRLVKIVGRSEEIGRPMLYGTTRTFLETFGLSSIKDLPKAEEFASMKGA